MNLQEELKKCFCRIFCSNINKYIFDLKVLSGETSNKEIYISIQSNNLIISPYDLHKFAMEIYHLGYQIYLGWEFIFIKFISPNNIRINFSILELT